MQLKVFYIKRKQKVKERRPQPKPKKKRKEKKERIFLSCACEVLQYKYKGQTHPQTWVCVAETSRYQIILTQGPLTIFFQTASHVIGGWSLFSCHRDDSRSLMGNVMLSKPSPRWANSTHCETCLTAPKKGKKKNSNLKPETELFTPQLTLFITLFISPTPTTTSLFT